PVASDAERDLVEGYAVPRRERLPQQVAAAVRVSVQFGEPALHRLDRRGKRSERAFVGRELDDACEPELALHLLDRLARLVRNELGDRPPKDALAHSSLPSPRLRQKSATPAAVATAAATAPPVRLLGTAFVAFCFATAFP